MTLQIQESPETDDTPPPYTRTVMMVVGTLEEQDLDNLAGSRQEDLHWLNVAITYTDAKGDALLRALRIARAEMISYLIEDIDIGHGGYNGRMADGTKIFFSRHGDHWLIFPRA